VSVEVGGQAPDFALRDQHGQLVRLSDFRDRKIVLLVFYPWAFTGVCTGELIALRDELVFRFSDDVAVLTVSVDSMYAQRVFAEREKLGWPLLADFWPHGAVAQAYGVFDDELGCARRGTFIIDSGGIVRWKVVHDLGEARDVEAYQEALETL
jgi:mycoredoxin-dependent peroxiredoxin